MNIKRIKDLKSNNNLAFLSNDSTDVDMLKEYGLYQRKNNSLNNTKKLNFNGINKLNNTTIDSPEKEKST
jgi:hypothetical protein